MHVEANKKETINQELLEYVCITVGIFHHLWDFDSTKSKEWGKPWYWLCCSVPKHDVMIILSTSHQKDKWWNVADLISLMGLGAGRWPVLCTKWLWISICSGQSSFKSYLNPAVNLDPNKSISLWNEHTLHNFRICEKNPAAKVKVTTRWTAEGISSQWSNPLRFCPVTATFGESELPRANLAAHHPVKQGCSQHSRYVWEGKWPGEKVKLLSLFVDYFPKVVVKRSGQTPKRFA